MRLRPPSPQKLSRASCHRVARFWMGTGGDRLGFLLEPNEGEGHGKLICQGGTMGGGHPILVLSLGHDVALPGASNTPEKTIPQGKDPPGADNGEQMLPPTDHKEVIPPPRIGDEDIYIDAPNPSAGHEEEVIPPPAPDEDPSVTPH
jgi:hypothetical protein